MKPRHILWVNEAARFTGGCEQYIYNTVKCLKQQGYRATLMYDGVAPEVDPKFTQLFDQAFPMVDIPRQVAAIAPDLIYIHRLKGTRLMEQLCSAGVPAMRFYHDYVLFCMREHKYKTLSSDTCRQPIGFNCYTCLGFVNRSDQWPGVRLRRLGPMQAEIRANYGLTAFVVGSQYMAGHLADHGFDSTRTHVLPLYAFPPKAVEVQPRDTKLILYAGQMIRGKGVDTLLHALHQCRHQDARLVLVGSGRQLDTFKNIATELGLNDRVTFEGQIPHEELARYYSRAAFLVVPSRYPETFGLIGPEAMSYGTPVIATDVGGIGEWMDHEEVGLSVPSNDPAPLAEAIDRLLDDPESALRMGAAGKAAYEAKFRPERHDEAMKALIEQVIAAGPPHG
ncbi:MAG: glycosyltransferase family 4 protein [Candidatus Hydrogenedentes bacterium]|nr:glycosyltransferase family 4 protein [Candidatus Hydrogenedentota bacterium]